MKLTNDIKTVAIVLVVIAAGFFMQKCSYEAEIKTQKSGYETRIADLKTDSIKLADKADSQTRRADSLDQQRDKQAALYGQSTATIATLKQTVREQAARLTTNQQIDAIAAAIHRPADGERIKLVATPADSALIVELYQRVEWGLQQAAKLDTALRENARLRVENQGLTTRETLYRRTLDNVRSALLSEADTKRFLGIGRRGAMLNLAGNVADQISDLEKELNGPRR